MIDEPGPKRNKDLSRIHIMKKDLGLDDGCYRELLKGVTGKGSAKDLDAKDRWRVMCEMARLLNGGKEPKKRYPGRPPAIEGKEPMIGKIEALLTVMNLPWSYAHAIAKKQWGIDMVQWCDAKQLRGVIAALAKHQQRRDAKAVPVPGASGVRTSAPDAGGAI